MTAVAEPGRAAPTALGVGVVVWLASELLFFAGLFAMWFTLRSTADAWPPDGVDLEVPRAAVATAVLVASSLAVHRAVAAAVRDDRRTAVRWLAVTAAAGTAFLANTVVEWSGDGFGIDSHAYGSAFYLLTGFHALHVAGGVLLLGTVAGTIAGASRAPAGPTVEVAAAYWHFVDVVWVAVFLVVYVLS